MYLNYYGLQEEPFGVTPDPRFLYLTPSFREAQSALENDIRGGRGFSALVAPPGMGKTTLLFHLLERYAEVAQTAFIFLTQCDSREFLRYLMSELGAGTQESDFVRLQEQFGELLVREAQAGKKVIAVVDEAQDLEVSVLETVRLLSDFETPRAKLLHVILSGQVELAEKLASPALTQLRQRISRLTRLKALNGAEVRHYIEHRLRVAGYSGPPLFTREARALILQRSQGIPRLVNNLCFQALSRACELKQKTIDGRLMGEIAGELDFATTTGALKEPAAKADSAVSAGDEPHSDEEAEAAGAMAEQTSSNVAAALAAAAPVEGRPMEVAAAPAEDGPEAAADNQPASAPALGPVLVTAAGGGNTDANGAATTNTQVKEGTDAGSASPPSGAESGEPKVIDVEALAYDCALFEMDGPPRRKRAAPGGGPVSSAPPTAKVSRLPVRGAAGSQKSSIPAPAARAMPHPMAEPTQQPAQVAAKPVAVAPVNAAAALQAQQKRRRHSVYLAGAASVLLLVLVGWLLGTGGSSDSPQESGDAAAPAQTVTAEQTSSPSAQSDPAAGAGLDSTRLEVAQDLSDGLRAQRPEVALRATRPGEELLHWTGPIYPAAALANHIEGPVELAATIGTHGFLRHIRVLNGNPLLANAVLDAVQEWRYQPRRERGRAVETETRIVVNFRLSARESSAKR